MQRKFGWIRDLPDHRDFLFAAPMPAAPMPPAYALPASFFFDQGQLGSCTANAVSTLYEMTNMEESGTAGEISPSRLALYYWSRYDQGSVNQDSGATIRGAIKAAATHGMCKETTWPYVTAKFKMRPSNAAQQEAAKHKMDGTEYARVAQTLDGIKAAILANNPIAFGFSVYESFMSRQMALTGIMTMPAKGEKMVGGHATVFIGWDDAKQAFLVKNSWGNMWGQHGNFWMPYAYALNQNLTSDLWTIYKVAPL